MITIQIEGVIGWDVDGRDIRRQLAAAAGAPVRVEINSPGGFVFDGLEIFNRLRNYSGEVHTHIMSLAASMGSYIALAGDKDKRTAEDNAVYMIHNVWGFSIGDHREMRAEADVLEGLTGLLSNAYAEATGKPLAEVREMMDSETYLFGDEIREAGFVNEIAGGSGDGQSANEPNRDGALAATKLAMDDCIFKMKERGQSKDEVEKVAALLKEYNALSPQGKSDLNNTANQGGKKNQEVVMDLQKLKAEHPALYAQVLQEGREAGRTEGAKLELSRVKAHLTMAESTGAVDFAIGCIADGKLVTDQEVYAGYMSEGLKVRDIKAKDDDSPDGDLDNPDNQDEVAAETDLLAGVMAHSKKSGAAVNTKREA